MAKARPEDLAKPSKPAPATGIGDLAGLIPQLEEQKATHQIAREDAFPEGTTVAFKFAFLGLGQGGSRIADSFYRKGYRRVGVVNTTVQDFEGLSEELPKLDLMLDGASKDPKLAAQKIAGREEEVHDLLLDAFGTDPDYVFVCAGLGGGTGTGLLPHGIKVAREFMESKGISARVGAIVSLPMLAEGQRVSANALAGMRELLKLNVSPLIVIDNARISDLQNKPGILHIYSNANEMTSGLLHQFNRLAACRSPLMTFDRSEFRDVLDQGITVMGASAIPALKSASDLSRAVEQQLNRTLLAKVELNSGCRAACLFVASEKMLEEYSIEYFEGAFDKLERLLDPNRDRVVHRGVYPGTTEHLQMFTLVSGLKPPEERLQELLKKSGMTPHKSLAEFLGV